MRGAVLYGPRDVRFEERDVPRIVKQTDVIIRITATCVCGSDLWPYRGIQSIAQPTPMGHEYCGIVEDVGSAVTSVKPGKFVIGSFFASDNTCPNCQLGYQSSCQHAEFVSTAQAALLRVPLADGTLVATPDVPSDEMVPSLLALSDVMGTGWFAADAANVKPGKTVVVVGDGAVGLLGVLSAKQMGADRIIAMSRHESRQKLAREFGATDIVTARGDEGVERIKQLTNGIGADSGAGVCRYTAVDDAGDPVHSPWRLRGLCRGPARSRAQWRAVVLRSRPPPRWARSRATLLARADQAGVGQEDQSRQGLRCDPAARPGGGSLPRNGWAPRDQDAAASLRHITYHC